MPFSEPERDPIFGESELGPSVTSNLGDNTCDEVATELERLLSALSYYCDQPAEVVAYARLAYFTPPANRA